MLLEEPEKEDGRVLSPIQVPDMAQSEAVYPHKEGLTKDYNIEDLLDVWRLSFHTGMISQLVIENNIPEAERKQAMDKVMEALFSRINSHLTLSDVLSNRMMLLGLIAEALELKEIK